jgi:hypothetical protein
MRMEVSIVVKVLIVIFWVITAYNIIGGFFFLKVGWV